MKLNANQLSWCVVIVALTSCLGCSRKTPASNTQLVGQWHARTVTTKLAGRPDETRNYAGKQLVTTFLPDGKFSDVDNGVPGETIATSGTYEVTGDGKLKETVTDATGSKFAAALKGRTGILDFTISADHLTLVMPLVDSSGQKMGSTEATFVRAPR